MHENVIDVEFSTHLYRFVYLNFLLWRNIIFHYHIHNDRFFFFFLWNNLTSLLIEEGSGSMWTACENFWAHFTIHLNLIVKLEWDWVGHKMVIIFGGKNNKAREVSRDWKRSRRSEYALYRSSIFINNPMIQKYGKYSICHIISRLIFHIYISPI